MPRTLPELSPWATILETLREENPDALLADGFELALVGVARRGGQPALAVYSVELAVAVLMGRDGMGEEAAREYLEFNTIGAWMGEGTPLWLEF